MLLRQCNSGRTRFTSKALSCTRRCLSTHPIEALPFRDMPQDVLITHTDIIIRRFLSSSRWDFLKQTLLPFLRNKVVIKCTNIKALYLPTFLYDGVATIQCSNTSRSQAVVPLRIRGGYLPGFSYAPLSEFAFPPENLDDLEPFDLATHSTTPTGEDVTVIPYTQSPLKLIDYTRSLHNRAISSADQIVNDPELRDDEVILPKSLQTQCLALYPIYQPVHLMNMQVEQEGQEGPKEYTIAAFNWIRFAGQMRPGRWAIYDGSTQEWSGASKRGIDLPTVEVGNGKGMTSNTTMTALVKAIQLTEQDHTKMASITKEPQLDLSKDKRFMRYSETNIQNREFMDALWNLKIATDEHEGFTRMHEDGAIGQWKKVTLRGLQNVEAEEVLGVMESRVEDLEEKVANTKPDWMS